MIKIGEGETAEVFKVYSDKVIKLFRKDFYNEYEFNIEYETAKYIGKNSNFAPIIYDKTEIDGRKGYLMEEIKGIIFQEEIDKYPEKLKKHAILLGKAHRSLHEKKISNDLDSLRIFNN